MTGLLLDIPSFTAAALCAETDPDAFYPEKGDRATTVKAICWRCDARAECLTYALDHGLTNQWDGIWGGTSPGERRRMTTTRAKRPSAATCGTTGGYVAHRRRNEDPCTACRDANRLYNQERRARRGAA